MSSKSGWARVLLATGMLAALGASGSAEAQQPASGPLQSQRTIRVAGNGEAQGRPDAAQMTFAVETFAPTASEAGQQNAAAMEQVVAALVRAGVARTDIETRNYTVFPEYVHDQPQPATQRIRGYRAMNQVVLRTDELARIGDLIDVALAAGANRVDGVSFELRQADGLQAEALRRAVARARASAETIAAALGVQLGEVLDASTDVEPIRPMPLMMRAEGMARDAVASTPIEPGEQTVRASVTVVFAIREG